MIDYKTSRSRSREIAELEWDRLWTDTWILAGFSIELPEANDFIVMDIGPESIVIFRNEEMGVGAFYNVCPHRGSRLVSAPHGQLTDGFRCPMHGLQFDTAGRCRLPRSSASGGPESGLSIPDLTSISVEEREGMVFINLADKPGSLEKQLDDVLGQLRPFQFDKMRCDGAIRSVWPANWKAGIDAFSETYHAHAIHPQTMTTIDDYNVEFEVYPSGCSRMVVPMGVVSPREELLAALPEALATMLEQAGIDTSTYEGPQGDVREAVVERRRAEPDSLVAWSKLSDSQIVDNWNFFLFPNVTMNIYPLGSSVLRFRPSGSDPTKCIFELFLFSMPVPEDQSVSVPFLDHKNENSDEKHFPVADVEADDPAAGELLYQDAQLLFSLQRGVNSKSFRGPRLSRQEVRLEHFHKRVSELLGFSKGLTTSGARRTAAEDGPGLPRSSNNSTSLSQKASQ